MGSEDSSESRTPEKHLQGAADLGLLPLQNRVPQHLIRLALPRRPHDIHAR